MEGILVYLLRSIFLIGIVHFDETKSEPGIENIFLILNHHEYVLYD